MIKKISFLSVLFSVLSLHATDKIECESLFKTAIENFYLENTCKFNKHLSSKVRKNFENKNCSKLFSDKDMKDLNSEVLGASYKKMKEVGRDKFCKNSKTNYDKQEKLAN